MKHRSKRLLRDADKCNIVENVDVTVSVGKAAKISSTVS